MFAPNTFLIGAQKSGTTFLASLLDQSPDVCVCDPKEPQFFAEHYETGAEAYERSFANRDARITMDASTTYTFLRPAGAPAGAPGIDLPVRERILDAAPGARFIYIMRDPVDRAVSAFRHNARTRNLPDGPLSLVAALDEDPMLELISRYADQIDLYFEMFEPDRFLFLRFEDLIRDTQTVLGQCCDFLGLELAPILEADVEGETHGAFGFSAAGRLLRQLPGLEKTLKKALPKAIRGPLADLFLRQPAMPVTFHDKDAAALRFAEDRARVKQLTGLTI